MEQYAHARERHVQLHRTDALPVVGKVSNFQRDLSASDATVTGEKLLARLHKQFPMALSIRRAPKENDMIGADYWIELRHGQFRSIDVKVRREDWSLRGKPEIALEIWSNVERQKPGWALDESKLTDYVLFYWLETDRSYLVDFRQLQVATRANLEKWNCAARSGKQKTAHATGYYSSQVVYVSVAELQRAIAESAVIEDRRAA